jgi:hypothetical protein
MRVLLALVEGGHVGDFSVSLRSEGRTALGYLLVDGGCRAQGWPMVWTI